GCSEQAGLEQWHSLHTNCTGPAHVKKRRWRWQQTVRRCWHCQQVRSSTSRVSSWKTVSAGQWYAMGGGLRARGSTPRQYIHCPAQELATCRPVDNLSIVAMTQYAQALGKRVVVRLVDAAERGDAVSP